MTNRTGHRMGVNNTAFALIGLLTAFSSLAVKKIPQEITTFITQADSCEYLAGEWDNTLPVARQQSLEKEINQVCSAAKTQQAQLRLRYRTHDDLLEMINRYDF
ncbi:hypothetical protein [Siccibacter turicensis]|uniref:hypothetical protein n=1 Tax=Siccibacter turicensis TaxID=357233 RepID=UPI003F563BF4